LLTLCKLLTLVYTRLLDLSLVYITRAVSLFLHLKGQEIPTYCDEEKILKGSLAILEPTDFFIVPYSASPVSPLIV